MNYSLLWANVQTYSRQVGLLVALGALVPALLRPRMPRPKLFYWQVLLAACLLLPFFGARRDSLSLPRRFSYVTSNRDWSGF
jgi:hypothetical protein